MVLTQRRKGRNERLVFHFLTAPDTYLTRRLVAHDVNDVRKDGWNLAEDGSLYTLPFGSGEVRVDRVRY